MQYPSIVCLCGSPMTFSNGTCSTSNLLSPFLHLPPSQGSVLVSLRFLQTSMEALAGEENTEIETEGYLLEKGVKETIMEYIDPLLKFLLLSNQVEEGATPAPGSAAT